MNQTQTRRRLDVQVAPMGAAHLEPVYSIECRSFPRHTTPARELNAMMCDKTMTSVVAKVKLKVVGFAYWIAWSPADLSPAGTSPYGAMLYRLAVDPIFRRLGVGRDLILSAQLGFRHNSLVKSADESASLFTWIREHNDAGIGFLKAAGFEANRDEPVWPEYFDDGEDAYFMQWRPRE